MGKSSSIVLRSLACLNAFTFSGAQVFLITLYPFFAERFGLGLPALIASFGLGSFLFLFGSPYWASKSDEWGRRKVLTIGSTALLLSFGILVALAQTSGAAPAVCLIGLLTSRLVYGLVASAIAPVAQSLQADLSAEDELSRAMFIHSISLGLGRVVSLSAFVLLGSGIQNMLFIMFIWIAFVFLLNIFLRAETSPSPQGVLPRTSAPRPASSSVTKFVKWPRLEGAVAIAFLFTCFLEVLNSSLSGSLQSIFRIDAHSAAELGARILLVCAIGILFLQAGRVFLKRLSWGIAMTIGVGSLALGSLIFGLADGPARLWTAFGFLTIGTGLVPPLYLSLLSLKKESCSYGKRAGLIGSAQTLGYAAGAGVSALAFQLGVQRIGFVLCALACLLAFASFRQRKASI